MTPSAWTSALLVQAVVSATPLTLAGLGELTAERAGVINVGIEGMMLMGAISGVAVGTLTGSAVLAVVAAVLAAMLLAAIFACATILVKVDQIVCGMAINLLAIGVSGTIWQVLQQHSLTTLPDSAGFSPVIWGQYGMTFVTALLALGWWWGLRSSRSGIIIRALGDAPEACAANGIPVRRWRFAMVLLGGACAGGAGAFFSVMRIHGFAEGMTGGRGFLVLALVIFGRWRVEGLIAGCPFFGIIESLQAHLQSGGYNQYLPHQLFQVLPYVAALSALAMLSRSAPGPAALGRPYPERSLS